MEQSENTMQSDHDLLIKLNENVTHMREEMRITNDSITRQVGDHEVRIRLLENGINSDAVEKKVKKELSSTVKWSIGILVALAAVVEPILILMVSK